MKSENNMWEMNENKPQEDEKKKPLGERVEKFLENKLNPEVTRLRERIVWIDELNLPKEALQWIGECSDLDMKEKEKKEDTVRVCGKAYPLPRTSGTVKTGFDLIEVHLMMLRERKLIADNQEFDRKRDFLRKKIEEKMDALFHYIADEPAYTDNKRVYDSINQYAQASTLEKKSQIFTLLLNAFHSHELRRYSLDKFKGIPSMTISFISAPSVADDVFLQKLNNFDRPWFWREELDSYIRKIKS